MKNRCTDPARQWQRRTPRAGASGEVQDPSAPQRASSKTSIEGGARRGSATAILCDKGCDRSAFGQFSTCCHRCPGPEGPHASNCGKFISFWPKQNWSEKGSDGPLADIFEELRVQLLKWDTGVEVFPNAVKISEVTRVIAA